MDRSLPALGRPRLLKGFPGTGPVPGGGRPKIKERQSSDGLQRIHQHAGRGLLRTPFAAEAQPSPNGRSHPGGGLRGRVRAAAEFDGSSGFRVVGAETRKNFNMFEDRKRSLATHRGRVPAPGLASQGPLRAPPEIQSHRPSNSDPHDPRKSQFDDVEGQSLVIEFPTAEGKAG